MFSDGIIDQYDTLNKNKFSRKRLKEVLQNIQKLSFKEQSLELESIISNWKGLNDQLDDMTILGFKIKF